MQDYHTFLDVLAHQAKQQPNKIAFTFLEDGESQERNITYDELYIHVLSLAALLQKHAVYQKSILLLFHSGLDYITAFLAVLHAGAIAVPAYPPKNNKNLERFDSIVNDCNPVMILTTSQVKEHAKPIFETIDTLAVLPWITTQEMSLHDFRAWNKPKVTSDDIAFLQYTSGSTGAAKGVMVSHGNLLHNEKLISHLIAATSNDIGVAWLPIFHDMGLIGMVLQPLYSGFRVIFMAPASFLQRPIRWLNAMSHYKATMTVTPNFGLDVCAKTLQREECIHLDLSHLRFMMCGAEPINPKTLKHFSHLLEPFGWHSNAFKPAFGLAEATLLVTATPRDGCFYVDRWDSAKLQEGTLSECAHGNAHIDIISSGTLSSELDVRIINPSTHHECNMMTIGEIVVRGQSVARGYWNNEIATQETFGLMITDTHGNVCGPFMRTGDLGYLNDDVLHVAGRTKDLIIVAGKNHYPQDIEWSVENALASENSANRCIQIGGCAAFSISHNGDEKLIVVAEITRTFMNDLKHSRGELTAADAVGIIRREVARNHQIQVHDIILIKPATLPKTSSGKVQRRKIRNLYLNHELTLATSQLVQLPMQDTPIHTPITHEELQQWLHQECSKLLELPVNDIALNEDLALYGFSSITAMRLHGALEDHLHQKLPQELLWEASCIEDIVKCVIALKDDTAVLQGNIISIPMDQHEPFALNPIQEAYWLGRNEHFDMGGVGCHLYIEFESEKLDLERLEAAWQKVVERHPMLRAVINENGTQHVLAHVPAYTIAHDDITSLDKIDKITAIDMVRTAMSHKTYDASQWPLFEIRTTQFHSDVTRVHFSYDLLIGDIWSLKLLHDEWGAFYTDLNLSMEPISITFRDYSIAQSENKHSASYQKALSYWNNRISSLPEAPKLPMAQHASKTQKPLFRRREKQLDAKTWSKLKQKGQKLGITPSALLACAFSDILSAWSQSRHFTLNLTLFNREPLHPDVMKLVGDFTTLLLLEVDNRPYDTFTARAHRLQEQLRNDLAHKSINGIDVMQKIGQCQGKNAALMPIVFTSALGFEEIMDPAHPDWLGKSVYSISQTPQVWLDHQTREEDGKLLYTWDSVDELFSPNVIDEMFETYTRILDLLAASDALWDDTMMCLTPGSQISDFKAYMPIPHHKESTLYDGFLHQLHSNGDNVALISQTKIMTYNELYHSAQLIAHELNCNNIQKGSLVAIVMEKSIEQMAAALGVLFYGCAYVPIDASTPNDRIELLIGLANSTIILTQSHLNLTPTHHEIILNVDTLSIDTPLSKEYCDANPNDLAYVIFTSGSTGIPKGVMISHSSVTNTIDDINLRLDIGPKDRFLGVSSFAFDLSVYDLFGALSAGAALVLPDPAMGIDPKHFAHLLNTHRVTLWNSAPALMQIFLEYIQANEHLACNHLQHVLLSGDWIAPQLPQLIRSLYTSANVLSLGGATEASIWSIAYPTDQRLNKYCKSIPYGKALKNQKIFILGDKLEPRPTWVTGEIYIAGSGLAMGYYQDEQKTDEKFIYHPMTSVRLYKTGDLGRVLPDGNVEFLGRKDFQVKISGYRVELGEIEHIIEQHPSVEYTIATTFKDPNGMAHLGAYIVPKFEVSKIKTSLSCVALHEKTDVVIDAIMRDAIYISEAPISWIAGKSTKIRFSLPNKEDITTQATVMSRHGKRANLAIHGDKELIYLHDYFMDICNQCMTDDILALQPRNGWNDTGLVACSLQAQLIDNDSQYPITITSLSPTKIIATCTHNLVNGDEIILALSPWSFDKTIDIRGQIESIDDHTIIIDLKPTPFHEEVLESEILFWIRDNHMWEEEPGHLNDHLRQRLPDYMIPKAYQTLLHIPLTCNGKIDRNLLPEFNFTTPTRLKETLTLTQQRLVDIWQEILGQNNLSIDDNFFDIGGYSQLAVRSLLKVKEVFQVDIPIRDLFGSPTIRALADKIDHLNGVMSIPSVPIDDQHLYTAYARQGIGERISTIRADKYYTKAYGTTLEYTENGKTVQVLDMVGGYGSTIFGHNHPDLVAQLIDQAQSLLPTHTQHTNNIPAGRIAKKLSDLVGSYTGKEYISTLGSTGTEATEAAIKHAKMAYYSKVKRHTKNSKNFFALLKDGYSKETIHLNSTLLSHASQLLQMPLNTFEQLIDAILHHNHTVFEQKPRFIALNHAFHGMTSGAISLTASTDFKKPFHWMELEIDRIAHTKEDLHHVIDTSKHTVYELSIDVSGDIILVSKDWHTIAAMFIEPIQGEGGIFTLNKTFAKEARLQASSIGFALIIDEIQSGMGRSGTFCASAQLDIVGDYYLFSKSLGGGLAKISAMLVESSHYEKDFGYYHGSTFAEDQPSCIIALKALELFETDNIIQMAREKGEVFITKLEALQRKYPTVFKEVRGMGLMLGIELANLDASESFLFRALSNGGMEILNHLIAGYLLNVRQIRIAPTKTRNTIRFLPSAYITFEEIQRVVQALEEIALIIKYANAGRLLSYTVQSAIDYTKEVKDYRNIHPAYRNDSDEGCVKVAHIGHVEDQKMLIKAEPSLMDIEEHLHEALLEVLFPVSKATITQSITVPSPTGERVNLKVIGIPLTGKQIEEMMGDESKNILLDRIDDAVQMAHSNGCTMVGMGGYTSIVTLNCTTAATTDIALTSGNGFTTALAIEGVENLATKKGLQLKDSDIAIVGAKGNIGSICAHIMAQNARSITLIGKDKSDEKLLDIAYEIIRTSLINGSPMGARIAKSQAFAQVSDDTAELYTLLQSEFEHNAPISIGDSLDELSSAHIVITATNAAQPIIFPHHLSQKTQIICDIATPNDVDVSVSTACPWIDLMLGGLATLPNTQVNLHGTRLPENHVYGCVAETMLLGLEGIHENFSFGSMSPHHVHAIGKAAKKHDFKLGILKSIDLYGHHNTPKIESLEECAV
jgi:amino acid adenylation domain-containing protein